MKPVICCFILLILLHVNSHAQNYSLQVNTKGIGQVTLNPSGGVYSAGTVVTLTASTLLGSNFISWSGDANGNTISVDVTMNAAKTVNANFTNSPAIDFTKPVGFASINTGSTYPAFNSMVTGGQNAKDTFWVNGMSDFDALAWRLYYRNRAYKLGTSQNGVPKAPLVIVFKTGVYPEGVSASSAWGNSMLTIQEQGDLTIIGEPGVVLNFGLNVKRSWNILIRNLSFQDYYDDGVNIGEPETHHVWVDHCTFGHPVSRPVDSEHPDGGADVKGGASYVTISWCLFRNSWKTSLIGHSDNNAAEDNGKLKVTIFANHYFQTNSRNPRVRFGEVHVLNNLYNKVELYGIVAANNGKIVAEGNFFLNTDWPMYADRNLTDFKAVYGNNSDDVYTSKTGNLPASYLKEFNNAYDDAGLPVISAQLNAAMKNPSGRSVKFDELNAASAFVPSTYYTYTALNANDVRTIVPLYAGAGKVDFFNPIPNTPEIIANGSLTLFKQNIAKPSLAQPYSLGGNNLTAAVTVTPPVGFEISADGGITWKTNALPLQLTPVAGTLASTAMKVRLNSTTVGTYSGSIVHSSNGASNIQIPLSGNAFQFSQPAGTAAVVSTDGTGDFTSVQDAINAAPTSLTAPYIIFIKNGKYFEKITVPSNKPFIHLVGESVANVMLYYNAGASDPLPGGGTVGTQNSASFTVNATDFAAFNISFANSYGDGTQAVAVLVNNDRAVFQNCRFLGNQDTLYVKGAGTPKHYFKDCYVDGNVDFIFGSSIAVFDSSIVYAKTRTSTSTSYITAANTPAGQLYGFVFRNAKLPNNTGGTTYFLGRPWQNSIGASPFANNKTTFLNSILSEVVKPEGWTIWDAGTNTTLIDYSEYGSKFFAGNLINTAQRVAWSKQLTPTEANNYTNANMFGAWDPCAVSSVVCATQDRDIAIANFRLIPIANGTEFRWNISWAKAGINYALYRSANKNGDYLKLKEVEALTDTLVNFSLADTLPITGTAFYYYLVASKAGYASHISDTLKVSMEPLITINGTLQPFFQQVGSPGGSQTITVAGSNLTEPIVVNFPAPFEISTDGGTTWIKAPATGSFTPTNGSVNASLQVRLHSLAVGVFSGNMLFSSGGANSVQVALLGTASLPGGEVINLQSWPLTANANDDVNDRAAGVTASTPTFEKLFSSNGTQIASIPAYSLQFGQAFGASTNGDGTWSTAIGGPGGTLRRTHYQQFTITAKAGYRIVVDSLYATAAFYNTSSNTRLAVVFSKDGFVADSSDIYTIPGGFTSPITLANQTSGPTTVFPLAFAIPDGVLLQPGQTLTIRLYFSCGSSSAGRYAMLKTVRAKGKQFDISALPLQQLILTGTRHHNSASLQWKTSEESVLQYFGIERSNNGQQFETIAKATPKNTNGIHSYSFNDQQPLAAAFYRIKAVDKNGKMKWSNTVFLSSNPSAKNFTVVPNPTSGKLMILHNEARENSWLQVLTIDGKTLLNQKVDAGVSQTWIDISKLQTGMYFIKVTLNGITYQQKIMKQ